MSFKVVNPMITSRGTVRFSAAVLDYHMRKEYSTAHPTVANVGGLLVFPAQADALRFIQEHHIEGCSEVWRCRTKHPVALPARRLHADFTSAEYVSQLWSKDGALGMSNFMLGRWPKGTKAVRQVQLTQRVYPKNGDPS